MTDTDREITDEEINAAFYQTGGDGWQVIRFIADDGSCGHALFHDKYQPDSTVGDITVPEMLRLAKELLAQAEIAMTTGARNQPHGAFHGKGAAGRERGAQC